MADPEEDTAGIELTEVTPKNNKDSPDPPVSVAPKKRRRCCDTGGKGCSIFNPTLLYGSSYLGGTCLFLLACNLSVFYDLQFPTTGSLLKPRHTHTGETRVVALIVMWGVHFIRRFGEVLFRIEFDKDNPYNHWSSIKFALCSLFYYCTFGFWIGWSVNFNYGYLTPMNYLFVPGILVFIGGELINLVSHTLQKGPISKKYYFKESITWLGFMLASFTLATCIFFLSRVAMIFVVWIWQKCFDRKYRTCNLLEW